MSKIPTEITLADWRYGQAQAERLCAELLHIENYQAVDPQSPLGGPDGLKDVLCKYNNKKCVAACYFATSASSYSEVEKKLIHDLKGVKENGAEELIFFVNQKITPGERVKLSKRALPYNLELYHLERMRALLDSPKGYGIRLEYLRIPMEEEEQFSLWSTLGDSLTSKIITQEKAIAVINKKVDILMERTRTKAINLTNDQSSLSQDKSAIELSHFPTASLSIGKLLWIHRVLTENSSLPYQLRGVFRSVLVWVGGSDPSNARFVPPAEPEKITELINQLFDEWCVDYPNLIEADQDIIINKLARFHHTFLTIHPFIDANGRISRTILQQQVLELLNKHISAIFSDDPKTYYECLNQADNGDLKPLETLIKACLE